MIELSLHDRKLVEHWVQNNKANKVNATDCNAHDAQRQNVLEMHFLLTDNLNFLSMTVIKSNENIAWTAFVLCSRSGKTAFDNISSSYCQTLNLLPTL